MKIFRIELTLLLLALSLTCSCRAQTQTATTAESKASPNVSSSSVESVKTDVRGNEKPTEPRPKANLSPKKNIEDFKPSGWHLIAKAEGDINGDRRQDAAAVFSATDPSDKTENLPNGLLDEPRLFVVGLRDESGTMTADFSSRQIILCRTCGGWYDDVLINLKIVKNKILLDQNILAADDVTYILEIEKIGASWLLAKGREKTRDRRSGKTTTVAFKTPIRLSEFNIENRFEMLTDNK